MKFLISVIDDLTGSGMPEEMIANDAVNDGLRANGQWSIEAEDAEITKRLTY